MSIPNLHCRSRPGAVSRPEDPYLFVFRPDHVVIPSQQFLVEFFPWPEAREGDSDILAGPEAGKLDEAFGPG